MGALSQQESQPESQQQRRDSSRCSQLSRSRHSSVTVTGTRWHFFTHTSSGTHTLTRLHTVVGTHSVTVYGTFTILVTATVLQTVYGTCLVTTSWCMVHLV